MQPTSLPDGLTTSSITTVGRARSRLGWDRPWGQALATQEILNRQRRRHQEYESVTKQQQEEELAAELADRAGVAIEDPYLWVTTYTETFNEHWVEEGRPSPYEPFPKLPYFNPIFRIFDLERITWLEKSRDMMLSWACVAYLLVRAMPFAERTVLMQTQKEDKAVKLVQYAKCLYRRQPQWLQDAFPLTKPVDQQPQLELNFKNGASLMGIPGGADQIRSYHPWGYLNDESSFQPDAGECYNEALSAVKGKVIFNSSAGPGWYADVRRDIVRIGE